MERQYETPSIEVREVNADIITNSYDWELPKTEWDPD